MDTPKAELVSTVVCCVSGVALVAVLGYFVERCEAHEQRTVAGCLQKYPPLECKLIELQMRE